MDRDEPLVYIVDDDEAVRDSLRLLLKSEGLVGQSHGSAAEFLDKYDPEQHGCLITDIRMPGMNGLELQDELNQRGAPIPLIFITGHGDVPTAVDALISGALDFIEKPFRDQDLLDRVHQVLTGDKERRAKNLEALAVRESLATLTPRETEVMERVVQGQASKIIAIDFGISRRTVELHRSRVMDKMGIRTVAKLVHAVEAAKSRAAN
jgi:FixJ family two-component response regulator